MKKIALIVLLLSIFISSNVLAEALTAGGDITAEGGEQGYGGPDATAAASATERILIGKLSTNVYLGVNYGSLGYAIDTKHEQGDKAYGTAADATAIYVTTLGKGVLGTVGSFPTAADYTSFNAWTEL